MTLLLVDDESFVRIGIRSVIQAKFPKIKKIIECNNGLAALDIVKNVDCDIALVDIRMPEMDGIEFIRQAKEWVPNCKFIILSCLTDFKYAQTALNLGVSRYVLKTSIDSDELISILRTVTDELEISRRKNLQRLEMEENYSTIKNDLLHEKIEENLENGATSSDNADDLRSYFGFDVVSSPCRLLIVRFDDPKDQYKAGKEPNPLQSNAVQNIILDKMNPLGSVFVFPKSVTESVIFCSLPNDDANRRDKRLQSALTAIQNLICDFLDISISFGVSSKLYTWDLFNTGYKEAKTALLQRFYTGPGAIHYYAPDAWENPGKDALFFHLNDICKKIREQMSVFNTQSISNSLEYLYQKVRKSDVDCIDEIKTFVCKIIYDSLETVESSGLMNLRESLQLELITKRIMSAQFLSTIIAILSRFYDDLGMLCENADNARVVSIVKRIKEHVHTNIKNSPNLSTVSAFIGFSPGYVSKLFKKYCNESFQEFLAKQKMQEAKRMIGEDLKLSEIAEVLGYSEIAALSRAFKRIEGMAPRDYRNRLGIRPGVIDSGKQESKSGSSENSQQLFPE